MRVTPGDKAKYRRLRAAGMSHREAVARSASTPHPDLEAVASVGVDGMVVLTEAEYTALTTKDPRTLYLRTP